MAEVSPPKWHLGHTAWFFEVLILKPHLQGYKEFDPRLAFVFNSYYESLGDRVVRHHRGALSRPTVAEVMAFRAYVDSHMIALLERGIDDEVEQLVEQALQHEQQHQELLLTDIKYILGENPLVPVYAQVDTSIAVDLAQEHPLQHGSGKHWHEWPGGEVEIGHSGDGFAFDDERGA